MDKLFTCLWFDRQGEEAARFYVDLFPNSSIDEVTRTPVDYPGGQIGDVLTVTLTLFGRKFLALNGGDFVRFNEAISLSIDCEDQGEVDRYWAALSAHPESEQCGWVKDRFGVSWQVIPKALPRLLADRDRAKAARVMQAMMTMTKIDVATIEAAAAAHRL